MSAEEASAVALVRAALDPRLNPFELANLTPADGWDTRRLAAEEWMRRVVDAYEHRTDEQRIALLSYVARLSAFAMGFLSDEVRSRFLALMAGVAEED